MSFPFNHRTGESAPRQTFWQAIVELWRGGRWYDAPVSRPHRGGEA